MTPLQAVVAIVVALFSGGGIGSALLWKSQSHKTAAEAKKLAAETAVILSSAVQKGYDDLLASMGERINRVEGERKQCQADLAVQAIEIATNKQQIIELTLRQRDMDAATVACRSVIVELQDRLDRAEVTDHKRQPSSSTVDAVKSNVGARRRATK